MTRTRLALFAALLLAVAAALEASRLVDALVAEAVVAEAELGRVELGRRRRATAGPELVEALAGLPEEIRLTYMVTPAAELPPHLAGLERSVRETFAALERAAGERELPLTCAVVHPEDHPDWERSLASQGLAPWRARRVEGDGYRDDELWSSLRVGYGPRPAAVLNGIGPEEVARLQDLVLAQLAELEQPRRPRVALDAPPGFDGLRELLATGAEVLEVDLETAAELPAGLDLVLWIEPEVAGEAQLSLLDAARARGTNLLVAGSDLVATERFQREELRGRITRRGEACAALWAHLGLEPLGGLLLDGRAGEVTAPPGPDRDALAALAPWLVRATGGQQDFRRLRGQPNGSLLLRAPLAFAPAPRRLDELALDATILASASELATRVELPEGELGAEEAFEQRGRPAPGAALAAWLEPRDPWSGRVVVLASSTPLGDERWEDAAAAHPVLARVLLTSLLSPERLVAARLAREEPAPLPALTPGRRALLRLGVVGLVPTVLALAWALRGRRRGGGRRSSERTGLTLTGQAVVAAALALAAAHLARGPELDATADGRHHLTGEEGALLDARLEEPAVVELLLSAPDLQPPEFRPRISELRRQLRRLAARHPGLELRERDPEREREALLAEGVEPVTVTSTSSETTRLFRPFAALRVRRGERAVVLELPTERSFERLPFRLVHALLELERGRPTRLALVSEPPRLSPAEAALEYQRRGLFTPREGDPYGALAALYAEHGFEVVRVDPRREALPSDVDAVVWLQPRREVRPTLAQLATHLAAGGRALVAGQPFRIRSRQREESALRPRYWPEPQFLDLDRHYLPELGLSIPREVLLDPSHGSIELETQVDAADGSRRTERLATTQPFLPRTANSSLPGLGELLLPFSGHLTSDPGRLAELGLRLTPWVRGEGPHAVYRWSGGDLPESLLDSNDGDAPEGLVLVEEPALLAALVEGRFPAARFEPGGAGRGEPQLVIEPTAPGAPEGRLLLLADAALLRAEHLERPEFDHEALALRAASQLALGEEYDALFTARRLPPPLALLEGEERARWRLIVVGAAPLLLLLVALGRRGLA